MLGHCGHYAQRYTRTMQLGNLARVVSVCAACFAAAASSTSSSNQAASPQYAQSSPPPSQPMDPGRALGLWESTFGAVKIEPDARAGGVQTGAVQGVWVYQ